VSHSGEPFADADVRGICGIGESTKSHDLTTIGRFGIGFKSVYAFTDSPEIHSGSEHFAIDSFVWPRRIERVDADSQKTLFAFPFRAGDDGAFRDIAVGLEKLGARTLLFLREIDEINWSIDGGASGIYLRSKPNYIDAKSRFVNLIGEETGHEAIEENWLSFEKPVLTESGALAGYVELAFNIATDKSGARSIARIADSTVVVFFPTIVPTNLGFLIQGPYRTTPSRDNIPRNDPWNQILVHETASLLAEALVSLRDIGLMSSDLLRTLPLDRTKFGEGAMLAPLFDLVSNRLSNVELLPCYGGGHASAKSALLARGQELRDLLNPKQLGRLFPTGDVSDGAAEKLWLSDEITQDRTPELRRNYPPLATSADL
jgi:hypothetical protein